MSAYAGVRGGNRATAHLPAGTCARYPGKRLPASDGVDVRLVDSPPDGPRDPTRGGLVTSLTRGGIEQPPMEG